MFGEKSIFFFRSKSKTFISTQTKNSKVSFFFSFFLVKCILVNPMIECLIHSATDCVLNELPNHLNQFLFYVAHRKCFSCQTFFIVLTTCD